MDVMSIDTYKNRDLLDVVIQKKEEQQRQFQLAESTKPSTISQRPNGNLSRPSSFVSKRSTNMSQSQDQLSETNGIQMEELSSEVKDAEVHVKRTIHSIGFLFFSSVILAALDLQILLHLSNSLPEFYKSTNGKVKNDTFLSSQKQYEDIIEVTTAFSTFVFILQMNCLLVCSMQFFFATKILKVAEGSQRAGKYLRDCSSSRFIATVGYFVSIPAFIITVMLYVILRLQYTPAVTSIVILSVGTVFCILCMVQNIYHWHVEVSRASEGLPVYESQNSKVNVSGADNFNTLV
ncbi:hypothetical protein FSP39_015024 [Pinctada imbricata]|uniref:Uncharacterized protein n=1 Tax=Pinctada imbricata TaxID=66713 RepID=A0AA89BVR4_PINIB|nr:hypothetical protein FSP39_015024 [Pinctada imbricata]